MKTTTMKTHFYLFTSFQMYRGIVEAYSKTKALEILKEKEKTNPLFKLFISEVTCAVISKNSPVFKQLINNGTTLYLK